jgi:hypothetical protein
LVHKQWLIFYPLTLTIVNILAFLAVYSVNRDTLGWSEFFAANFERGQYLKDHFFAHFSFTPTLGIALFVGIAACALGAMIKAPFFRAVAGPAYPLAPVKWKEAANLFLFYLFLGLVSLVLPLAGPSTGVGAQLIAIIVFVISILVAFADYVIVYEGLGFVAALRRSLRLLSRRAVPVILIFVIFQLIWAGIYTLYSIRYQDTENVLILLPITEIIVESFVILCADLALIFLYDDTRRRSPA